MTQSRKWLIRPFALVIGPLYFTAKMMGKISHQSRSVLCNYRLGYLLLILYFEGDVFRYDEDTTLFFFTTSPRKTKENIPTWSGVPAPQKYFTCSPALCPHNIISCPHNQGKKQNTRKKSVYFTWCRVNSRALCCSVGTFFPPKRRSKTTTGHVKQTDKILYLPIRRDHFNDEGKRTPA